MPTRAIVGAKVDALAGVMKNLEVVVIEGPDHGAFLSHPKLLEGTVEFLKRHPPTLGRTSPN